jgi:hypothetical protein
MFAVALDDEELANIRTRARQQKVHGSSRFQAEVGALLARNVLARPRGRPRLKDEWWPDVGH